MYVMYSRLSLSLLGGFECTSALFITLSDERSDDWLPAGRYGTASLKLAASSPESHQAPVHVPKIGELRASHIHERHRVMPTCS